MSPLNNPIFQMNCDKTDNMIDAPKKRPEIIIIGGGFGGLNAVKQLKHCPANITLVDRQNYHLFQPLLYQVATAVLSEDKISAPIRKILRNQKNVSVAMGRITGIDLERKTVQVGRGEKHYDYLVIACGLDQAYFGHDEYKPFAPGLKSLDDALEIKRRILMAFEEAEYESDEAARRGKLTFVVVGGGPTGVELAGAIMETATYTLPREFRFIDTTTARVLLVEGGDRLLKGMPRGMGERAHQDLMSMGVEIKLQSFVTEVNETGVKVGEEQIPAENVFWAAGVQGTPVSQSLGIPTDKLGRVIVRPDLSITGHPEVFVVGDAAHVMDRDSGQPVPAVAQGAIQMGKFVGKIIQNEIEAGKKAERPTFTYFDKGAMATIGRGKAVASIKGFTLDGFLGWLAWGLVHIMFLVGFQTKLVVMLDWIWNYMAFERGTRIITGDPSMKIKEIRGVEMYDPE
jgi:NADH dehydrogenase